MTEKSVANIVIRVWLDATESVMGTNGLKALLNYAGMSHLLENLPDYSFEKNYAEQDFTALASNFHQILGTRGLRLILRQIGKTSAKSTIDMGIYDSFTELPPVMRLFKTAELFSIASGRGTASMEEEVIVFDNPECTACSGIGADAPICSIVCGYLDELAIWAEVPSIKTVETHCKAVGDATCRYEVRDWGTAPDSE